jgi:hypothetical protein
MNNGSNHPYIWTSFVILVDHLLLAGFAAGLYHLRVTHHFKTKYMAMILACLALVVTRNDFREIHRDAVKRAFATSSSSSGAAVTKQDLASTVFDLMNPVGTFLSLVVYFFGLGFGLALKFLRRLYNIHEWVEDLLTSIYEFFANVILPWLNVPFDGVMWLVKKLASFASFHLQRFIQLFQDAGNMIINTLLEHRDKAIREFFGNGQADEEAYDRALAVVLAYQILVVGSVSLVAYVSYYYVIPRIPHLHFIQEWKQWLHDTLVDSGFVKKRD